jgi:hypothetical protein
MMTTELGFLKHALELFPCPEGAHIPGVDDICASCSGLWFKNYKLASLAEETWSDATIAWHAPHLPNFDMEFVFGIRERRTGFFLDLSRSRVQGARRPDSSSAAER